MSMKECAMLNLKSDNIEEDEIEQVSDGTESKNKQESPKKENIPWAFRLNTFKPILKENTPGKEQVNYWTLEGNVILIGFHGNRETYGETKFGELVPSFSNDGRRDLFVYDGDQNTAEKVLPIIIEDLKNEKNININEVTRAWDITRN